MKPNVYVTRPIPGPALKKLQAFANVELRDKEDIISKEELLSKIKGKDAILSILTDPMDAQVIAAGDKLKLISNYGAGFDKVDVPAATSKGILVTNTPGALTETTADTTFALMLAAARRLVEGDKLTRECKYEGWGPSFFLGWDVHGKTLGILGMGKIGYAVAKRAIHGFGMKVIYNDRGGKVPEAEALGARAASLDELFKTSDFISLHVPLTAETKYLVNAESIAKMKPNAILVNTARGNVIDQKALAKALKENKIAAAALDVYEDEPRAPIELIPLSNVILAPHVGSASIDTRSRMSDMAVEAIVDFFSGKKPANCVNPQVLAKA